ncbi:MAG: tRNA (5-methylaminomethyl-2-thiouridine)(34)-methyltransferase MnmD [Bacteroidales bacterium]|nr:tRNA (5-methylaminomethyl-2-thiouridine)(34)-methyltransferase MnmD [Bacteroidales bacterium]
MNNRVVVKTNDGSDSLYVTEIDEHYHSIHGARSESEHIFLQHGLAFIDLPEITVLEIGFGTGLNCLLSYKYAQDNNKIINYHTIEKYPLTCEEWGTLNYNTLLGDEYSAFYKQIHTSLWNISILLEPNFKLQKYNADVAEVTLPEAYFDVVFFDAFSPEKQPELWTASIFHSMYKAMKVGGVLTTYCSKGIVRRAMKEAGFTVNRTPGPPGKREMVVSRKV